MAETPSGVGLSGVGLDAPLLEVVPSDRVLFTLSAALAVAGPEAVQSPSKTGAAVASVTATLRNPTGTAVAFKVKTTAPSEYLVKPNSGIVQARSTVDVQCTGLGHKAWKGRHGRTEAADTLNHTHQSR
jgi:hypothetical protein